MRNLLTIFLFLSLGAKAQVCCVQYTPGSTTPDSVKFQFDTTAADNVAGFQAVTGDPSKVLISGTVSGTPFTYTSVGHTTATWNPFGSPAASSSAANGVTTATIPVGFTGVMKETWFTDNAIDTTHAQVVLGGFRTDGTLYDVYLSATLQFNVTSNGDYTFKGTGFTQTMLQLRANAADGGGAASANKSTQISWTTGVAPDGSGNFSFYMGHHGTDAIACLSYIIIKKHGE